MPERRFYSLLGALALVLASVPYLVGWILTPAGHVYTGLTTNIDDSDVYLAWMRHVADGDSLQVIILSDGAYRAESTQQLAYAELRRAESAQAAKTLGYGEPEFWGLPDRRIEYGELLVQRIEHAIETFRADLVYAPSIYEMHPDHRALGMAAVEAVRRNDTKLKLAMYEVGVPMLHPNLLLDISDLLERKQEAME